MQLKFISHEGKNCALRETSLRYKKFEWNKTNQQCPRLELSNYVYIIERIPDLHIIVKYDVQKKLSETTIKVRGLPK